MTQKEQNIQKTKWTQCIDAISMKHSINARTLNLSRRTWPDDEYLFCKMYTLYVCFPFVFSHKLCVVYSRIVFNRRRGGERRDSLAAVLLRMKAIAKNVWMCWMFRLGQLNETRTDCISYESKITVYAFAKAFITLECWMLCIRCIRIDTCTQ